MIETTTESATSLDVDWLVIVSATHDSLPADLQAIDEQLSGRLSNVWSRGEFGGTRAQTLAMRQLFEIGPVNLLLTGVGDADRITPELLRRCLLTGFRRINQRPGMRIAVVFAEAVTDAMPVDSWIELTSDCVTLAPVGHGIYKQEQPRHQFSDVSIVVKTLPDQANSAISRGVTIGDSVGVARTLVNRSAMQMTPSQVVAEAKQIAADCQLEIQVLDAERLAQEKMTAMLAVAQGSDEAPALVGVTWHGNPDSTDNIALVGKGVTFDSGGLSIKPSDSMIPMKSDMAGAATALAAVSAAAKLRIPVNVTAWLGLAENMISGRSYRPGDVITARTGLTIEVQNTDAEGRLVLADVLSYAIDNGATHVVDLATLTGACVIALGEEITGLFAGCSDLAERIQLAADRTGEFVWPMPMHDYFDDLLKSDVADCRNIGPRWGGAVTAACFLRKFVGTTPWVHLDIAGPSWSDTSNDWRDSGGTGAVVRTLVELLRGWATETKTGNT